MLPQPVLRRQAAVLPLPHCHRLPVRASGGELIGVDQAVVRGPSDTVCADDDQPTAIVRFAAQADGTAAGLQRLRHRRDLPCFSVQQGAGGVACIVVISVQPDIPAAVIAQQIDLLELQIKDTQDRITENEAQEEQQYQLFCRQVRQEEERGAVSYWSVLFKATGFADLLSRMDFINEIVEHDQSVIDQLRTLREQLAQDKADLEQQQAELTASKTELDAQVAEATRVFEEYAASEAGQQALLNQQAAREKELQEEIRKSEEANRNNQTAVGGFIWPTACRLITGGYGGRDAPCPGASTYHLGVDIGASWGSDIYATKAGTVKVANEGWNYGLGYCVKIQHDDGTSTVYGHMSRVIAVVGQRVAQGQVIGKIGSTGVSTGPHLHYEIRIGGVNGTAVNPLPYLPGYVRYGW